MSKLPAGSSKVDVAYEHIKGGIMRADYLPGHRLPLAALASDLGYSVVPVREAIRRLEAEGLATYEKNVGARVALVDEGQYTASMQVLGLLEGAATSKAAPYLTEQDLAAARAINDQMRDILEDFDPIAFTQKNREFHSILYTKCPNPRLVELVNTEWERLGNLRGSTFTFVPGRARESVAEHYRILDLITVGASEAEVERAARDHRKATLASYQLSAHQNTPATTSH